MRIILYIQYEGTGYRGWQVQPEGITIQGLLQDCLYRLTGEKVKLAGAGRTDAGVHAIEQVASFETSSRYPAEVIKRAVNAMLPDDIKIIRAETLEVPFHARYSAVRKRYIYLIANETDLPVFLRRYVWWVKSPLDLDSMRKASRFIIGTHDFSSFRGAGCGAKSTVRTIYSLDLEEIERVPFIFTEFKCNLIKVSIEAEAFLRHMVRNIVGTLVEIGRGRFGYEEIQDILSAKDRRRAGPTAPSQGLFLERVIYSSD
jgi:tRNA pseudouridine38-40 synthase